MMRFDATDAGSVNAYLTDWDAWKKHYTRQLEHPADFERVFVDKVLSQLHNVEPSDVIPQYHFKDSRGGNRYIDYVIKNDAKGYSLAIELDGLTKIQAHDRTLDYARYDDMMLRQNDLLRLTGIKVLLRFTNKQAFNQTDWVIRQIQEVLRNQATQTKKLRDEQAKQEQLKKEYESVKATHHTLIQQKDLQIQQLQQSYEQRIKELESQPPVIAWVIDEPQEQQVRADEAVVVGAAEPDLPIMPTVTPDMVGRIKSLNELNAPKQEAEQEVKRVSRDEPKTDFSEAIKNIPKVSAVDKPHATNWRKVFVVLLGVVIGLSVLGYWLNNPSYHQEHQEGQVDYTYQEPYEDMSGDGTDSPYYSELTLGDLNSDNASPLIIEPTVPTTVETVSADTTVRAAQANEGVAEPLEVTPVIEIPAPTLTLNLPIPHELEQQRAVQPDTMVRTENKEDEKKVSTNQRADRDINHTQQSQTIQNNPQQEKQNETQARVDDEPDVQRQDRDGGY